MPLANPIYRPQVAEGRLTLASGSPVTVADQTAKSTVYFSPYKGNRIALFNGVSWDTKTFAEVSVAVPGNTVTPFDIFVYDNGGTITLDATAWTNDTTRATAITLQDGTYVKSGATGRRYLGTGRTTSVSGETESSVSNRFLWNYYNQICQAMVRQEPTTSWTYNSTTARQANASTSNQLNFVVGVAEATIHGSIRIKAEVSLLSDVIAFIGLDGLTAVADFTANSIPLNTGTFGVVIHEAWAKITTPGYHYLVWVEQGAPPTGTITHTYYGQSNFGMAADILC